MSESADLVAKLKDSHPDVQQYVTALKAENAKLHKRIFQLEAENVSLEHRITAIKEGQPDDLAPFDEQRAIAISKDFLQSKGFKVTKTNQ